MSKKAALKLTVCYECKHHKLEAFSDIEDSKQIISLCKASPLDGGMNFVTGEYKEPTTFEACSLVNADGQCKLYEEKQ